MGKFNPTLFTNPTREQSYNDDVILPHYRACNRAYSGAQRKGIRGERPEADSIEAHVREALAAPFFLSQEIELPPSLNEAVELLCEAPPGDIKKFWIGGINGLRALKAEQKTVRDNWRAATPIALKGVSTIDPVMLPHLFHNFGLGGAKWLKQIIFGFPITGLLSQKGAYAVDPRAKLNIYIK